MDSTWREKEKKKKKKTTGCETQEHFMYQYIFFFQNNQVMVDNPKLKIGLNESTVGIAVPPFFMDSYRSIVGHRTAGGKGKKKGHKLKKP